MRTAWPLSTDDLARANAGAPLIIGIAGSVHPVVNLMFGDPPADRPAGIASPSFTLVDDERPDRKVVQHELCAAVRAAGRGTGQAEQPVVRGRGGARGCRAVES